MNETKMTELTQAEDMAYFRADLCIHSPESYSLEEKKQICNDKLAAKRGQRYRFMFVHEDGAGLGKLPELLGDRKIEASVDTVFPLDEVNAALAKVAAGGSKGKTVLKVC